MPLNPSVFLMHPELRRVAMRSTNLTKYSNDNLEQQVLLAQRILNIIMISMVLDGDQVLAAVYI